MADKVYLPESIEGQELPIVGDMVEPAEGDTASYLKGANGQGEGTVSYFYFPEIRMPEDISGRFGQAKEVKIPMEQVRELYKEQVVTDIIGTNLDTQSKRILGGFTFGKLGSLQIGDYEEGETGDIRITPDGIVARNIAGVTTFALDGDTGDATFAGTIMAGSVISGSLVTGSILISDDGIIQIGSYEAGVSGDIRLISSGVISRNASGDTTFSIDGVTGDVIFKGTIQAGSVISTTISASNISAGTLGVVANIGDTSIKLDGPNRRIIINDGSNDRILVGKLTGAF